MNISDRNKKLSTKLKVKKILQISRTKSANIKLSLLKESGTVKNIKKFLNPSIMLIKIFKNILKIT